MDALKVKEMDQMSINHNVFIEYHGGENSDEIVVLPLQI
jgi:hypothetical protein